MIEKNRILLVDDDEMVLSCLQDLLSQHFDLDVACGSYQAFEAMTKRGPYAVVVSDMTMPGMTGLELLSKAKQISPRTVGLLLSGNVEVDAAYDAVRMGIALKVVEKPCAAGKLIHLLEEALAAYENKVDI